MQMPLQIAFHGIDRSEDQVSEAEKLIERLEAICGDLVGCRIAIAMTRDSLCISRSTRSSAK